MVKINKKLKRIRLGKNQKRLVTLLLGGVALSLSASPKKQFQILGEIHDELKNFDEKHLKRSIKTLYESRVINYKEDKDGRMTVVLSEDGKKRAITYDIDNIKIKKPKKWDGKWRIVLFDVPERKKRIRDVLRNHLRAIGFFEFQKSVLIHPYDCKDEIDYIIETYEAREFVRFVVAETIDNELHIKSFFGLLN
ncbi:hypothetical protein KKC45_03385 [Patescibacteria group bacterium]|nr:hypothetical protein [Patescibacteria group bacterium]